jgi:hypothetical protein
VSMYPILIVSENTDNDSNTKQDITKNLMRTLEA